MAEFFGRRFLALLGTRELKLAAGARTRSSTDASTASSFSEASAVPAMTDDLPIHFWVVLGGRGMTELLLLIADGIVAAAGFARFAFC